MTLDLEGFNREPGWRTYTIVGLDIFIGFIFLFLKTSHLVTWNWFLVLLPFYWAPALVLAALAIAYTLIGLADAYREIEKVAKHGKIDSGTTKENTRENT